jgi:hypothetical protein
VFFVRITWLYFHFSHLLPTLACWLHEGLHSLLNPQCLGQSLAHNSLGLKKYLLNDGKPGRLFCFISI